MSVVYKKRPLGYPAADDACEAVAEDAEDGPAADFREGDFAAAGEGFLKEEVAGAAGELLVIDQGLDFQVDEKAQVVHVGRAHGGDVIVADELLGVHHGFPALSSARPRRVPQPPSRR